MQNYNYNKKKDTTTENVMAIRNYSKGKGKNNCNSPVRKENPFKGTGYKGHQCGKRKKSIAATNRKAKPNEPMDKFETS